MVNTFGTGKISENSIIKLVRENVDLTPGGIIERLKLRRPIYRQTAAYGHFGRDEEGFTWEEIDMVDVFKRKAK
jgi:S-adenosylmethionine synthetase